MCPLTLPVEIGDQSSIWFDLENENISPLVPQVHIFIFHNKTKQKQLAFDPIYMSASGSGICYLISEFVYRLCIEELIAHTSYFHGIIPLLLTIAENLIQFDLKQFYLKVSSYWPWIFSLLSENGDPWVNSSHKHTPKRAAFLPLGHFIGCLQRGSLARRTLGVGPMCHSWWAVIRRAHVRGRHVR